jgi:hypothetical protein
MCRDFHGNFPNAPVRTRASIARRRRSTSPVVRPISQKARVIREMQNWQRGRLGTHDLLRGELQELDFKDFENEARTGATARDFG